METLTEERYHEQRARIDAHEKWIDTIRGANGWASYRPEDIPADLRPAPTNEERSAVEIYEFLADPPERYFCYVKPDQGNPRRGIVTTFTGDKLGDCSIGNEFASGFGGHSRRAITVETIGGETFHGFYYCSSGDYCRIRVSASSKRKRERTASS